MGFAASSARLYMLVARKSDLEFQLQMINQARLRLTNQLDKMYLSAASLDPDNPFVRQQEPLLQRIQAQDKRLELIGQRITMQHQAIETEIGAVNKVISQNIQSSFKLMG
jgi:hypothetical protein